MGATGLLVALLYGMDSHGGKIEESVHRLRVLEYSQGEGVLTRVQAGRQSRSRSLTRQCSQYTTLTFQTF